VCCRHGVKSWKRSGQAPSRGELLPRTAATLPMAKAPCLETCEDVGIGVGADEEMEMTFQLRNDVRRDCDPATSGICLGRPRQ